MADERELYRRELMKIGLAGLTGLGVAGSREQDEHLDANLSVDYDFFVRPDDPAVQRIAADTQVVGQENGYRLELPDGVAFDYVDDDDAFGGDHWQLPADFIVNGWNGDCEDYAITVTSILEAKGYDARVIGDFAYPVDPDGPVQWARSYLAKTGDIVADRLSDGVDASGHTVVETVIDGDYYVVDNATHPAIRPRDVVYRNRSFDPDLLFGPDNTTRYNDDWADAG